MRQINHSEFGKKQPCFLYGASGYQDKVSFLPWEYSLDAKVKPNVTFFGNSSDRTSTVAVFQGIEILDAKKLGFFIGLIFKNYHSKN